MCIRDSYRGDHCHHPFLYRHHDWTHCLYPVSYTHLDVYKRQGQVTVDAMKEAFGTKPEDLIACVGPSICRDCFEVGGAVVEEFRAAFGPEHREALYCQGKRPGKYQLDLWKANEIIFREAGIHQENILSLIHI